MKNRVANYVQIFDTTLRDGEQSPGATLTSTEKLEIARSLARLGVDVMEAGFPAASPDDLEGVRRIAIEVGNMAGPSGQPPIICGLARATKSDDPRVIIRVIGKNFMNSPIIPGQNTIGRNAARVVDVDAITGMATSPTPFFVASQEPIPVSINR